MNDATAGEQRISVALVTRNRPDSLERTLRSLRAQDTQPYEVVVSDDSEPDAAMRARAIAARFECRYVVGPQRGLYANRNHAALVCTGTHVRTMDDDHEFPAGHFRATAEAVLGDAEAIWIIGERQPAEPIDAGFRCPPQLHPRGFSVTPTSSGPLWAIADGAAIYPRTLFDQGARLVEDFSFGASYLEWGSRLHWLGYRIRHLASTYVVHYYDPETRSYSDDIVECAARFFAMFAHSFLYQPSLANRALCTVEVGRQLLIRGSVAARAAPRAWRVYRRHRGVAMREYPRHVASARR